MSETNIPTQSETLTLSSTPTEMDPLAKVKAKLTPEEKENFFKAFVTDKPYIAEETLFDGKLVLKFTTLSIKQNNTIMLQMQFDKEKERNKWDDAYLMQIIQYRLAASLLEMDHKPFAKGIDENQFPTNETEGTTFLLKRLELFKEWPVFKISAITDAFNRFERKARALTEECFKMSF
jgi:hypothetical protein